MSATTPLTTSCGWRHLAKRVSLVLDPANKREQGNPWGIWLAAWVGKAKDVHPCELSARAFGFWRPWFTLGCLHSNRPRPPFLLRKPEFRDPAQRWICGPY